MALTAYTGGVVAPAVLGEDPEGGWAWLAFIAVTVVVATGWRLVMGQGPLERLLSTSSRSAAALAVRHVAPRPRPAS